MMTISLENKLAMVVKYLTEKRAGRMTVDEYALNSYLDDPEVAQWLDELDKKGQIKNTRFTRA